MKRVRLGKGCHLLPTIAGLLADKENWCQILSSKDYHFPGTFSSQLGFCEDVTSLPNYAESQPDFLFYDIQLGKGRIRSKRTIELDIGGKKEKVCYMFAPCKGVKYCGSHSKGCEYVTSTRESRPCSVHPEEELINSHELAPCPVEFVYVHPEDKSDNRRWLAGIVRGDHSEQSNLHNHLLHSSKHIPHRVRDDLAKAAVENPHLKTRDLALGELL